MLKNGVLGFLSGLVFIVSCKKDSGVDNTPPPTTGQPVTAADKMKDTALMYSRDIYLWNSQIPASFNPRTYADPDKVMKAIRAYSTEPGFTGPVDRWSFAYKQSDWDNVSSGAAQDFGITVFFYVDGDLRVKTVEKNSPAGKAGVRRGWKITKLNGNSNITNSNANFIIEQVYNSTNTTFTFQKPDGTTSDIALAAAGYQENPLYLDTVYSAGGKNVGYLVFNSFLGDTTQIYTEFQRIFNRFAQAGAGDVIVDLRYNGGGYVSVQNKLANYLVNSSATGGVMMKQEFNELNKAFNSTTNFSKIGSFSPSRIFFIVSDNTASASELLINNLKPYADVKLVGPSPTYGKPVGYFPIPVGDWYIFPVSFRSTNKNGVGNYFNGFQLDKQVADGLNKDWGDKDEASLASILRFISTGSYSLAGEVPGVSAGAYRDASVIDANKKLDRSFKGAVDTRRF